MPLWSGPRHLVIFSARFSRFVGEYRCPAFEPWEPAWPAGLKIGISSSSGSAAVSRFAARTGARPGAAETSEASSHRYRFPCMPPFLPPFMAPFMPPAPPRVPLMAPLARTSLPPKKPPLLPPATPPEGFWRFWNAPPAAPDSGSPTSPPPAVNAINAVGARKRTVNARISLRMALPPYGKHMGNSQSARRFPTFKQARARDPCQEGHAKYLRLAVSRLRQIPPLLKARGPCRNSFFSESREDRRKPRPAAPFEPCRLTCTSIGC